MPPANHKPMSEFTQLLNAIEAGEPQAAAKLLPSAVSITNGLQRRVDPNTEQLVWVVLKLPQDG